MPVDIDIEKIRSDKATRIHRAAQRVRHLERKLDVAKGQRDAEIANSHGRPVDGGLTHNEIVRQTGMSKSRVRQIVDGARRIVDGERSTA